MRNKMKSKMKNTMILATIFSFFSCENSEQNFINQNKIILCSDSKYFPNNELTKEAINFEKGKKISFDEASKIYLDQNKKAINDSTEIFPSLIINNYYVYSFKNIKTLKIATFGIWIDADTGEVKNIKKGFWLEEKKILKRMSTEKNNKNR